VHSHPHFDLQLHDDDELAALLGSPLAGRATMHEWPLSCVQRLRTADGRTHIYKVQAEPTVEPAFYDRARSPLLAKARMVDVEGAPRIPQGSHDSAPPLGPQQNERFPRGAWKTERAAPLAPAALLLEDIGAPRLDSLRLTEAQALDIARDVLIGVARISGDLPAVADVRTEAQWSAYAGTMLDDLVALVDAGTLRQVGHALIERLARWTEAPTVLGAIRSESGYVHRDLSGENLFVLPEGYRVIDWQRPIWGPVALDLADLMESLGFAPRRYVTDGIVQLLYLLRIAWFAQCARRWFPAGAESYDAAIVALAARLDGG
jgi:hypothetical protein